MAPATSTPVPEGIPERTSATTTDTAAATTWATVRSIGAISARKVIGTAKSSGQSAGMTLPTVAPT